MAIPAGRASTDATADESFDPTRRWRLHPQVAIRPEPFGALLYHFGTRKLAFLKSRKVLSLVEALAHHPDAHSACAAAGITGAERPAYLAALDTLVTSCMLISPDAEGDRS